MRSAAARMPPAILASIGHGTHLCAFYETADDLIDLVLPFFDAGSRRGELCVWLAPERVDAEDAAAVAAERGIELYPARAVSLPVVRYWETKFEQAMAIHHSGVCGSGDAPWVQASDWDDFLECEADLNRLVADRPMVILCTYPLSISKAGDIIDVAACHHVALARRRRAWEVIKGWGFGKAPVPRREDRLATLDAAQRIATLSPRERQILEAIMDGRSSKTISENLGVSVRTVEGHRARMLTRLGVRTIAEAVRLLTLAHLVVHQPPVNGPRGRAIA